jgi:hypothetical protein
MPDLLCMHSGLNQARKQKLFNILPLGKNGMRSYAMFFYRIKYTIPACAIEL